MTANTDAAPSIYIWFAESAPVYGSDGERFIRAWTDNPEKVAALQDAIGREPSVYRASTVQAEPVRMDERAAFEHWCKTHCGLCDRDLHQTIAGAYRSGYVDDMWDGWSARAGLAASSAKAREVGSC